MKGGYCKGYGESDELKKREPGVVEWTRYQITEQIIERGGGLTLLVLLFLKTSDGIGI